MLDSYYCLLLKIIIIKIYLKRLCLVKYFKRLPYNFKFLLLVSFSMILNLGLNELTSNNNKCLLNVFNKHAKQNVV